MWALLNVGSFYFVLWFIFKFKRHKQNIEFHSSGKMYIFFRYFEMIFTEWMSCRVSVLIWFGSITRKPKPSFGNHEFENVIGIFIGKSKLRKIKIIKSSSTGRNKLWLSLKYIHKISMFQDIKIFSITNQRERERKKTTSPMCIVLRRGYHWMLSALRREYTKILQFFLNCILSEVKYFFQFENI